MKLAALAAAAGWLLEPARADVVLRGSGNESSSLASAVVRTVSWSDWIGNHSEAACVASGAPVVWRGADPCGEGALVGVRGVVVLLDDFILGTDGCSVEELHERFAGAGALAILTRTRRAPGAYSRAFGLFAPRYDGATVEIPVLEISNTQVVQAVVNGTMEVEVDLEGCFAPPSRFSEPMGDIFFQQVPSFVVCLLALALAVKFCFLRRRTTSNKALQGGRRIMVTMLDAHILYAGMTAAKFGFGLTSSSNFLWVFTHPITPYEFRVALVQLPAAINAAGSILLAAFWAELERSSRTMQPLEEPSRAAQVTIVLAFLALLIPPSVSGLSQATYRANPIPEVVYFAIFSLSNFAVAVYLVVSAWRFRSSVISVMTAVPLYQNNHVKEVWAMTRNCATQMNRFGLGVALVTLLPPVLSITIGVSTPLTRAVFIASIELASLAVGYTKYRALSYKRQGTKRDTRGRTLKKDRALVAKSEQLDTQQICDAIEHNRM